MDRGDGLLLIAMGAYALALISLLVQLRTGREIPHRAEDRTGVPKDSLSFAERPLQEIVFWLSLLTGLGTHTTWLVSMAMRLGHVPLISTQEVFAFLAWTIVLSYLSMRRTRRQTEIFGLFVLPLVILFVLVALVSAGFRLLPEGLKDVLHMPALPLHISFMMLAYAGFLLAFLASVMYLLQERALKRKRLGLVFRYFPPLSTCEVVGHRSLLFGFLMLTLGIAMGIVLLRRSDPIFWRGDPIIVLALITWIFYLIIVHYRLAAGWRGRRAAMLVIVGFLATAATFVSARLFGHIL